MRSSHRLQMHQQKATDSLGQDILAQGQSTIPPTTKEQQAKNDAGYKAAEMLLGEANLLTGWRLKRLRKEP